MPAAPPADEPKQTRHEGAWRRCKARAIELVIAVVLATDGALLVFGPQDPSGPTFPLWLRAACGAEIVAGAICLVSAILRGRVGAYIAGMALFSGAAFFFVVALAFDRPPLWYVELGIDALLCAGTLIRALDARHHVPWGVNQ